MKKQLERGKSKREVADLFRELFGGSSNTAYLYLKRHFPAGKNLEEALQEYIRNADTPKKRRKRARRREAAMTKEQRSKRARDRDAAMTPAQRSARSRKADASRTKEERSASVRKGMAGMTPAARSAKASKAASSKTPEQRRREIVKFRQQAAAKTRQAMLKLYRAGQAAEREVPGFRSGGKTSWKDYLELQRRSGLSEKRVDYLWGVLQDLSNQSRKTNTRMEILIQQWKPE